MDLGGYPLSAHKLGGQGEVSHLPYAFRCDRTKGQRAKLKIDCPEAAQLPSLVTDQTLTPNRLLLTDHISHSLAGVELSSTNSLPDKDRYTNFSFARKSAIIFGQGTILEPSTQHFR